MVPRKEHATRIAFFGDMDNLFVSLATDGLYLDPGEIMSKLYKIVPGNVEIVVARLFADWAPKEVKDKNIVRNLNSVGFELIHCPTFEVGGGKQKPSTDAKMNASITHTAEYFDEQIDVYVIATGDIDFLETIKSLKFSGRDVRLVTTRKGCSSDLRTLVGEDNIVFIEGVARSNGNGNGGSPSPNNGSEQCKWSWSREEVATHCPRLFETHTPQDTEVARASLPEHFEEVVLGCIQTADEQFIWGEKREKPVALSRIKDVICTPHKPPPPEWSIGVSAENIMSILIQMAEAKIFNKHITPDKKLTHYTMNESHPFVIWWRYTYPQQPQTKALAATDERVEFCSKCGGEFAKDGLGACTDCGWEGASDEFYNKLELLHGARDAYEEAGLRKVKPSKSKIIRCLANSYFADAPVHLLASAMKDFKEFTEEELLQMRLAENLFSEDQEPQIAAIISAKAFERLIRRYKIAESIRAARETEAYETSEHLMSEVALGNDSDGSSFLDTADAELDIQDISKMLGLRLNDSILGVAISIANVLEKGTAYVDKGRHDNIKFIQEHCRTSESIRAMVLKLLREYESMVEERIAKGEALNTRISWAEGECSQEIIDALGIISDGQVMVIANAVARAQGVGPNTRDDRQEAIQYIQDACRADESINKMVFLRLTVMTVQEEASTASSAIEAEEEPSDKEILRHLSQFDDAQLRQLTDYIALMEGGQRELANMTDMSREDHIGYVMHRVEETGDGQQILAKILEIESSRTAGEEQTSDTPNTLPTPSPVKPPEEWTNDELWLVVRAYGVTVGTAVNMSRDERIDFIRRRNDERLFFLLQSLGYSKDFENFRAEVRESPEAMFSLLLHLAKKAEDGKSQTNDTE